MVLTEPRVQRDIHEALKSCRADLRHSGDRLEIEDSIADDSELAASLGYEHRAVGKECDRPRLLQAAGHNYHAQVAVRGLGRLD
jgi:hypothetical protein